MKRQILALGAVVLALTSSATLARAQSVLVPRTLPQRALIPATAQTLQHRYFGTLQTRAGQMLTIQLRTGRLLVVDATQAFALQRVSEPLFAGKPTVVDGIVSANGVFNAVAVKRGASLPYNWGLDR